MVQDAPKMKTHKFYSEKLGGNVCVSPIASIDERLIVVAFILSHPQKNMILDSLDLIVDTHTPCAAKEIEDSYIRQLVLEKENEIYVQ